MADILPSVAGVKSGAGANLFSGFRATSAAVEKRFTDELVIVLCGPIGSPMRKVSARLAQLLPETFDYKVNPIRLSEFIESYANSIKQPIATGAYERVTKLIELGNKLRAKFGGSYLVEKAIEKIATYRAKYGTSEVGGSTKFEPQRVCHIIDSIKNEEELNLLRDVYGDIVFFVGVFSPLPERQKQLENRGITLPKVFELIDRDSGEEIEEGQRVARIFHQADLFLRVEDSSTTALEDKLKRFIKIILNVGIQTPTVAETAMYFASSAACKSACLSRQVGAAITDKNGKMLAVGWNEVPTFGGGLYGDEIRENSQDHRCMFFEDGVCHNDKQKDEIAQIIAKELIGAKLIPEDQLDRSVKVIRNSRIKSLIEFSRSVHAEMDALINAGAAGIGSLKGAKLFCTTYPCHSCARHLIAAGIHEVYFIEPYSKSLATRLHSDSITEDERISGKMRLLAFEGVAPRRYKELFQMKGDRKENGLFIAHDQRKAKVKSPHRLEGFPILESVVVTELNKKVNPEQMDGSIESSKTTPATA